MMKERKTDLYRWILIALAAVFMLSLAWHNSSIWLDEAFTMNLIRQPSLSASVQAAVDDVVHPPLYYILLIGFEKFLGCLWKISAVPAAKLFSVLWVILAMVQGSIMICHQNGSKASLLFIVMAAGTEVIGYSVEIRMYSMAMYATLIAWLYGERILKRNTIHDRVLFTTYTILAIWTHYFCAVYLSLIWFVILCHDIKEKKAFYWIISFLAAAVSFFPWMLVILTHHVAADALRSGITISSLIEFLIYPFYVHNPVLTAVIAVLTDLTAVFSFIKSRNTWIRSAVISPAYTACIGILLSLATGKFFTGKYLLPGWMVFYAGMAESFQEDKNYWKLLYAFLALNLLSCCSIGRFENQERKGAAEILSVLNSGSEVHAQNGLADLLLQIAPGAEVNIGLGADSKNTYYLVYKEISGGMKEYHASLIEDVQFGGSIISIYKSE